MRTIRGMSFDAPLRGLFHVPGILGYSISIEFDPRKAFIGVWYNNVPPRTVNETWHLVWIQPIPMIAIRIDWHRWEPQ